jgi:branched-chain amino acid transport system permease protein
LFSATLPKLPLVLRTEHFQTSSREAPSDSRERVYRLQRSSRSSPRLVGLPVGLAVLAIYAVAGTIAALGGVLYASSFGALKLSLGCSATVIAFTAAVIGGRGSLLSAAIGGLALGIGTTLLAYVLPSGYRDAIAFVVLVGVLVIWPDRRRTLAPAD